MKRIFRLIIVLILIFSVKLQAQYKDFVVSNKSIIGLTEKGKLIFFDKENGEKINSIDLPSKAVLLTKDKQNKIVIVDKKITFTGI